MDYLFTLSFGMRRHTTAAMANATAMAYRAQSVEAIASLSRQKYTAMQFTPYQLRRQRSGFHYVLLTICQVLMCPRELDCKPHPTFDVLDVNVAPHLFYILLGNE